MVSESLIYSRRLASGLRTQKRERETLTLEKRSVKRGGLTFSSVCSASPAPRSRAASTFVGNRGKSDARVSTRGIAAVSLLRDARATHEDRWAFKGHVAAPELPRAGQRELEPQDTWRPRSCLGLGSGSWSRRTRGGPGAAPAGQRELEPQDTWWPRSCPGLCGSC
jgi:hypothetical protein